MRKKKKEIVSFFTWSITEQGTRDEGRNILRVELVFLILIGG